MSTSHFIAPSLAEMNELLSAFEFESELSANDIGAVYYARQKSLERYVAVKLFSPAKGADERFLASLKRSSTLVAGLKHPNLIGFIDSGVIQGMPFLVMEFVPGKSLHRSTHGHAIEFKQAMAILGEICEGMTHAHEMKAVHGNLSPLNILLNRKASPKIGNFALGRGIHTLPEVAVPSHFSAPEVLAGETHTVASDVYSLGAMLYELITATPWRQGAARASELEGSPAMVDKVIEKACHSEPAERYQSAKEFYQALEKAASNKLKSGATPPPARPAVRSKAMAMATSTSGMGIATKAVIIVVLLIAIKMVWGHRNDEIERRKLAANDGQSGNTSQSGKPSVDSFEMRQSQRQAQQRQQQVQPEPEVFPDDPETPMESLERLRAALTQGNFSELPIGTISQQGSHYFLVEEAMTWHEALVHAEELGGSVALPTGDMSWSGKEPFAGRGLWLGAGRSGADAFTLINGEPWKPQGSLGGSGSFVQLDAQGALSAAKANSRLAYAIQWGEGAKALSFEERMAAAAKSIGSGSPVFPPGTLALGERHYLPVPRSVSWEEAGRIAASAGGHLMALSDDKEGMELGNWSGELESGKGYWLGGRLNGERWEWSTGEPWRAVKWSSISNAAADDAAMILRVGSGIDATAKSGAADGFIIEWSEDPATNRPQGGEEPAALTSPSELSDMAKQLVIKAIADKEAAHTKNTDKLAWDLKAHLRGLNKSEQELWAPEIEKLNTCVQNNRLLKETIEASGAQLSPFMAKLCNYLIRKQDEIDEQHAKSLQAIHASYLKKLEEIRDQAVARGQVKAQVAATELIDGSQNLDSWVSKMSAGAP